MTANASLCLSKSKNTASNSKGEEEEEKVKKCQGASQKTPTQEAGALSSCFFLILSLALHLSLQHLYF